MKLKNKKTGKVLAVESISSVVPTLVADKKTIQLTGTDIETGYREMYRYKSLAELAEEWEDAPEEPKGHWYLNYMGDILYTEFESINPEKKIGNYFKTKEEAEKAVEKLKAWKRLKDHNLVIKKCERMYTNTNEVYTTQAVKFKVDTYGDIDEDLDLLFGGEE